MNQLEIYKRLIEQSQIMKYMADLNDVKGDKQGFASSMAYRHAQVEIARLAQEVLEGDIENE